MMEWLKAILDKAEITDGVLNVEKLQKDIEAEFPKHAVPKADFNDAKEQLKTANATIETLKKDNKDNEALQQEITGYKAKVSSLEKAAEDTRKTYALKEKLRDSVRSIVSSMGIENEPLESQEKWAACCSFGGQGSIADPGFAKHVREKRIALGDKPYIAYCINCRDAFLEEGKETYHILDLVFDREPRAVTVSARRENRILLKENILKEFFKEEMDEKRPDYGIELYIDDELSQKLSREKILEEDMENAVSFCENTGQKLFDTEAGTYKGWRKIGHATYWVEYKPEGDGYRLLNGYSHRMEIEMEHIWNGHKTNFEV